MSRAISAVLCWLFYHRTHGDRFSGAEYMTITTRVVDGIGRVHAEIKAPCARCGKTFRVGQVHMPEGYNEARRLLHWWLEWSRAKSTKPPHSPTREYFNKYVV